MTRPNSAIVVTVIALVIAGIASWEVYSYLQKEARKTKTSPMGKAVVAVAFGHFPYSTGQVFQVDGGFHIRTL